MGVTLVLQLVKGGETFAMLFMTSPTTITITNIYRYKYRYIHTYTKTNIDTNTNTKTIKHKYGCVVILATCFSLY